MMRAGAIVKALDYGIELKKGVLNKGNFCRIERVMKKAMAGEDITVGFWAVPLHRAACALHQKPAMPIWSINGGVIHSHNQTLHM